MSALSGSNESVGVGVGRDRDQDEQLETRSLCHPSFLVLGCSTDSIDSTVATLRAQPPPLLPASGSPHLLHLLLSLSTLTYLVTLHSFVLSPLSIPTLFLRVAAQIQFSSPRKSHPHRSLRYFVAVWLVENALCLAMTVAWGSRGTKGERGWTQRGVLVDFIGQVTTPSKVHMVALDLVIALLQLLTVVISFAITLPSDLDASTSSSSSSIPVTTTTTTNGVTVTVTMSATTVAPAGGPGSGGGGGPGETGEAARDYFGLLGLHEDSGDEFEPELGRGAAGDFELSSDDDEEEEEAEEEQEDNDDDDDDRRRRTRRGEDDIEVDSSRRRRRTRKKRTRGPYEFVETHDRERDDDEVAIDIEDDNDADNDLGGKGDMYHGSSSSPRTTTTKKKMHHSMSSGRERERVPFNPIAKLRFRHVWNEIRPGSFTNSFERIEERQLRAQEEGRRGGAGAGAGTGDDLLGETRATTTTRSRGDS